MPGPESGLTSAVSIAWSMSTRDATMALLRLMCRLRSGPAVGCVVQSRAWPSMLLSASMPSVAKWTLRPPVCVAITAI
ncbi:hypothetical protein AEGHOMDF_5814 [Methylobacterium soli]|nr:hypothetical protein AEGHOMDF_5814 [Methylobacterium soli]